MTKTSGSRRISSAMASRNASRMVMVTISVPSGTSGSGAVGSGVDFCASLNSFSGTWPSAASPMSADAVCGVFAGCGAGGLGAAPLPSLSAAASSPSARIMAIGVLTATSLVPSGTRILPSVPSSTASTSMVALSVSISAITSPDLTVSPSFLSHLERLPFSMVGDSAGMRTSVGMACFNGYGLLGNGARTKTRSTIHVGVKLGRIGLGVLGGELGRFVDGGAHRRVEFFQLIFAGPFLVEQAFAHLLDRVVLSAHFVDLLLGPVFGRIRHGVSPIAIGHHFQNGRALAGAAPGDGGFGGRLHRTHVHAVDLSAGNVERQAALGEVGLRRGAQDRGAHGIAVVLDDIDHGELPQLRHVEALVDLALVGGAVAEIGQRDAVVAAIFVGKGQTGAERHLGCDDAVPAIKILVAGEHVHRAALALGIAAAASGQFRHHALGVHAASQHVAVIAIAGDHLIAVFLGQFHADDDGFLADIEVAEAADQAHAVHLAGLLLEAADQEHLAQRRKLLLLAEFRNLAVMHAPIDLGAKLVSVFFGGLGFGDGHSVLGTP